MDKKVFFIHGLKGTPEGGFISELESLTNVQATKLAYMAEKSWDYNFSFLKDQSKEATENSLFLGISMGGFFAAQLANLYHARAYLVNPVICPALQLTAFIGALDAGGRQVELTESVLNTYFESLDPRNQFMQNKFALMLSTQDAVVNPAHAESYFLRYTNFVDHVEEGHAVAQKSSIELMAKRLTQWL